MDSPKSLARPAYLLAIMFVIIPLGDALMSIWPMQPGLERWRYGAVGAVSNIMLVPLFGFFLAMATSVTLEHRRTRKVLGWLYALAAIVFGAAMAVFVLDFFQTRSMVRPELKSTMDAATTVSVIKQTFTLLTFVLLSGVGFRGSKAVSKTTKTATPQPESPILIRVAASGDEQ